MESMMQLLATETVDRSDVHFENLHWPLQSTQNNDKINTFRTTLFRKWPLLLKYLWKETYNLSNYAVPHPNLSFQHICYFDCAQMNFCRWPFCIIFQLKHGSQYRHLMLLFRTITILIWFFVNFCGVQKTAAQLSRSNRTTRLQCVTSNGKPARPNGANEKSIHMQNCLRSIDKVHNTCVSHRLDWVWGYYLSVFDRSVELRLSEILFALWLHSVHAFTVRD